MSAVDRRATRRPSANDERMEHAFQQSYADRLAELMQFVRIPSISASPQYAESCAEAAAWLANMMVEIGLEHVEVVPTDAHPIVYGDWLRLAEAPTVLVYAHYDVQPAEPLDVWSSPPFEPVVDGNRLLGRGTSDAKAQVMIHLWAIEELLRTQGTLPVNVRLIFEGDEESGSAGLDRWLVSHRDTLSADVAVVSDTSFFEGNRPSVTVGLRGICYLQLDVIGAPTDLHSGANGGAIANPAGALCDIVASLKTPEGRIAVEGFYDDVLPLTDTERSALSALPFDEESYRRSVGAQAITGEAGYSAIERLTARPTLDLCGIWGGFQGEGQKTIIPAAAHAKISCRLVPNQDPERVFAGIRDHILRRCPLGVSMKVTYLSGGVPTVQALDHPATVAAARALPDHFRRGAAVRPQGQFGAGGG